MAPFIGKTGGSFRIMVSKCEIPNTFLEIEFKVTETQDTSTGDESDEEVKENGSPASRA